MNFFIPASALQIQQRFTLNLINSTRIQLYVQFLELFAWIDNEIFWFSAQNWISKYPERYFLNTINVKNFDSWLGSKYFGNYATCFRTDFSSYFHINARSLVIILITMYQTIEVMLNLFYINIVMGLL